MSSFYTHTLYQNKIKTPAYRRVMKPSKKKRDAFSKSLVISVLLHLVFVALLFLLPEPKVKKSMVVTLEQWQQERPKPVLPKVEEVMPKLPTPIPRKVETPPAKVELPPVKVELPTTPTGVQPKPVAPAKPVIQPKPAPVVQPKVQPKAQPTVKPEVVTPAPVVEAPTIGKVEPSTFQNNPIQTDTTATEDWQFLIEDQNTAVDMGRALLSLSGAVRHFKTAPNFTFLETGGWMTRVKSLKVELKIASDGTILTSRIIPPGSGEPALDREIRNVLKNSFLNDIALQGRGTEEVILTINFKD